MPQTEQAAGERRFALRIALRIPLTVTGRGEDESAWSEPTETDDISTIGASFGLNQRVKRGDKLHLRAQRGDGRLVEVDARVTRTALAAFGCQKVGVQIDPPDEAWLRLFVSWVADTFEPEDELLGVANSHA